MNHVLKTHLYILHLNKYKEEYTGSFKYGGENKAMISSRTFSTPPPLLYTEFTPHFESSIINTAIFVELFSNYRYKYVFYTGAESEPMEDTGHS